MSGRGYTGWFDGRLVGLMSEADYDRLAARLAGAWIGLHFADPTAQPASMTATDVAARLVRLKEEVAARKLLSVAFPFTYVRDPDAPTMIKLYDPRACGSGCSTSSPQPWWVFSTVAPSGAEVADLRRRFAPPAPSGFFTRLFGRRPRLSATMSLSWNGTNDR
jgi:hypothetical protein